MTANQIDKDEYLQVSQASGECIESLLEELNVNFIKFHNNLRASCPIPTHQGDADCFHSFSWYLPTNTWTCFSHHCEADYGKSVHAFIRAMLGCSLEEAHHYLKRFLSGKSINYDHIRRVVARKKEFLVQLQEETILPNDVLKYLNYDSFWHKVIEKQRGIGKELQKRFQIGYWSKKMTALDNRLVIPVRNLDGNITGFTGRICCGPEERKKRKIPKWKHVKHYAYLQNTSQESFKARQNLFNIYGASIHCNNKMVIVEGPFDGINIEKYGCQIWVGTFGDHLTKEQVSILKDIGIRTLIIAYDADEAGDKASKRVERDYGSQFNIVRAHMPNGKDPGDLTYQEYTDTFKGLL